MAFNSISSLNQSSQISRTKVQGFNESHATDRCHSFVNDVKQGCCLWTWTTCAPDLTSNNAGKVTELKDMYPITSMME